MIVESMPEYITYWGAVVFEKWVKQIIFVSVLACVTIQIPKGQRLRKIPTPQRNKGNKSSQTDQHNMKQQVCSIKFNINHYVNTYSGPFTLDHDTCKNVLDSFGILS